MRESKERMMMSFARVAGARSACSRRTPVGAVITPVDLSNVVAIGYNGPVRGGPNACSGEPGACGCVHAEANALVKPRPMGPEYALFVTTSPCEACAKLIVNAGVSHVFYGEPYRDARPGLDVLRSGGLTIVRV